MFTSNRFYLAALYQEPMVSIYNKKYNCKSHISLRNSWDVLFKGTTTVGRHQVGLERKAVTYLPLNNVFGFFCVVLENLYSIIIAKALAN